MEQAPSFLKQLIDRYEEANFTVTRRMGALIKEQMTDELTIDQLSMLRYIRGRGRCTSSELADTFCVGKSSITAIVNRLFDKNLIVRIPDERDRRVIYLSVTEEGERLSDEMREKIQELLSSIMQHFNEQEAHAFIETFEKLAHVLMQTEFTQQAEKGDNAK